MALSTNRNRGYRQSVWTTWAPSLGVVVLVGAHVLAAALGLYSSAPAVRVLQPVTGVSVSGQLEIAVQADDGPTGSGVRSVEYRLGADSTEWMPLELDSKSMTYKASAPTASVPAGGHELYIRARDYTGNQRTVFVNVSVSPAAPKPAELHPPMPVVGDNPDLSSRREGGTQGWGGRVMSAMLRLR